MKTEDLIGLFVKGSLKNGSKFYGTVLEATDEMLTLAGKFENSMSRKYVVVSEIAEFFAEPLREKQNE